MSLENKLREIYKKETKFNGYDEIKSSFYKLLESKILREFEKNITVEPFVVAMDFEYVVDEVLRNYCEYKNDVIEKYKKLLTKDIINTWLCDYCKDQIIGIVPYINYTLETITSTITGSEIYTGITITVNTGFLIEQE